MRLGSLVFRNIHRHRRSFAFSMVGIVIGVTSFVIFLALGEGLRQNVLERIYVVNQLEVVPRSYEVGAFQGEGTLFGGGTGLDDFTADDLRALPGVVAVYPKMQLAFPSIAAGGEEIFGRRFWTELIADGIPEDLIQSEMPPPDDPLEAFRDWDAEPLPCDAPGEPGRGPAVGCPAGRLCTPQGFCERAACTPSDEVLAAPDRDTAERVQACLERHFQGRAGLGLSLREIPEDRRAPPDEPPFRLAVSPRYLDETRRVLGRTLPAESPPPAPDDEADDADAHEQPDPCDDVPGRDVVTILGGEERTCDDPPSYCTVDTRRCEMPVPVIASPFLFEVFDTNVQTILSGSTRSLPRLTREGLIGFTFDVEMGRGVLGSALRLEDVGRTSRRFASSVGRRGPCGWG